ncbi:10072_t:CDS:2, partial [Scutellospora calospora]
SEFLLPTYYFFATPEKQHKWYMELNNLIQRENEKVDTYATKFKKLLSRVDPEESLPAQYTNLNEAIVAARKVEAGEYHNNITPQENLIRFLNSHMEFLRRERRHVESFFRYNDIRGRDLEESLEILQDMINEQLNQDLNYERSINGHTIENLMNQLNTMREREDIFIPILNGQGQVL